MHRASPRRSPRQHRDALASLLIDSFGHRGLAWEGARSRLMDCFIDSCYMGS